MSKIETVKALDSTERQREAVRSVRELQQTLEQMNPEQQAQVAMGLVKQTMVEVTQKIDQALARVDTQIEGKLNSVAAEMEPLAQALATLTDESKGVITEASSKADSAAKLQKEATGRLVKATKTLESASRQLQESAQVLAKARRPSLLAPVLLSSLITTGLITGLLILLGRL